MKFTIDRKTWLRGDPATSFLLRPTDRKMCCVGQMCKQLGIPEKVLEGETTVGTLLYETGKGVLGASNFYSQFEAIGFANNKQCAETVGEARWLIDAYGINDLFKITDVERERQLIELLAKYGHELTFTD